MGKKKFNFCTKCNFRHASPTGKGCLAGDGEQALDKPIEDKTIQGGQASGRVGLDGRCDSPNRKKAGSSQERMEKIEQDMTAMGGKLDLIIANMKKPTVVVSDEEEVVESWTKDIADAWSEVKDRSRQKHKPAKLLKRGQDVKRATRHRTAVHPIPWKKKVIQSDLREKGFSQKTLK